MARGYPLFRQPLVVLAALCLVAYGYFYQAGGWNQNSRFDLTRAIVEHGSASIDPYERNTGDKARKDGHFYCDKAPGASWLAVPLYAGLHLFAGTPPSPRFLAGAAWATTLFAVGLPAAIAVALLAWLLGALGLGPRARIGLALAYGLATLAWPYATLFYGHQLAAALLLASFALLVRARLCAEGAAVRLGLAGALAGGAVAVEYPSALAVVVLLGYAASFVRPWRRLVQLGLGLALPGFALALYHAVVFGGPGKLPYDFSTQPHRSMGFFMGLGAPDPAALAHILITPYRGLFFSAPWLLLALPGGWLLARAEAGRYRREVAVCAAVFALYLWLNASLVDWQGGWAMGARYLVPALPFVVVPIAGCARWLVAGTGRVRRVACVGAAALVTGSAALMLLGTAVKPEVPVQLRHPFGDFLWPAFRRGALAISTQTIDSSSAPPHAPRAAWNLGQLAGLPGLWSLVPLALVLALGAAWLWRLTAAGGGLPGDAIGRKISS